LTINTSCSTLYSLNAARIDFVPYQFRPALKFIRSDRPRMLIADGVGVGKTIEAGLILRELQARSNIQSVLVICPRPLVTERKWEIEMRRFDERFIPLDGPLLRRCINETDLEGRWPIQYQKAILPYSLLTEELLYGQPGSRNRRSRKGLLDLDPPPRFGLVIVDEAHLIDPKALTDLRVLISPIGEKIPLKILLCGQENLRHILKRSSHADLLYRITLRLFLKPYPREQTALYIDNRITMAGGSPKIFEPEAKGLIHDYAAGVPRQINNISTACLLNAASQDIHKINDAMVNNVMAQFQLP